MRDQIKTGDGASGSEKERQIDEQHLKPALIEANDHGGKKHRRKKNHQWITDVRSEVKKGFSLDVPGCIRTKNLRKDFFCGLHQALGPARLLCFEAVHIDGKFTGTFHVREIEKLPAFELRAIGKISVFGQGVVLPTARGIDRGAAPDSGGAVEIEERATARAAAVFYDKVAVE